jgi:hypothetical protein
VLFATIDDHRAGRADRRADAGDRVARELRGPPTLQPRDPYREAPIEEVAIVVDPPGAASVAAGVALRTGPPDPSVQRDAASRSGHVRPIMCARRR